MAYYPASRARSGLTAWKPKGNRLSAMFAGVAGTLLLPRYSDVGVGSAVASVTDISGNGKNATQATEASKPILRQNATTGALYWEMNDDFLQCAALGLNAADEVTVFAVVHKTSDAAAGVVCELTNNTSNFSMFGPSSAAANFGWRARGSGVGAVINGTFAAPVSAVLVGTAKISTDTSVLRVNGVEVATSAADQGTGNFGNFGLFIGRRDGSSLPFAGNIYVIGVANRVFTASEILALEAAGNAMIGI